MIKEIKKENESQLAHLKKELWKILEYENKSYPGISNAEYYVVLYFLLLHKEAVFSELDINDASSLKNEIYNVIAKFKDDREVFFGLLQEELSPIINRLNVSVVQKIILLLESLNQKEFNSSFTEIFDGLLFKLSTANNRFIPFHFQPKELTEFICGLVDLRQNSLIYNPFAGLASFSIEFDKNYKIDSQELDRNTHTMGLMRLIAYNRHLNNVYIQDDSLNHWNYDKEKYDLIISNPPFAGQLQFEKQGKFGLISSMEHFVIEKGIEDLKPEGKLITVTTNNFLSRRGSVYELRKYLVDNDLLEMVVKLPGGIQMESIAASTVLVINKAKKNKGLVQFVDGMKYTVKISKAASILDSESLLYAIKNSESAGSVMHISNNVIVDNDYNLDVPRYFIKPVKGSELRDLMTLIRGEKKQDVSGKIIRIRDLKDDRFNASFEIDGNNDLEIPTTELEISESCLLVALAGKKLKPTYFKYTGTPIYVSQNISCFVVNQQKVDIEYLISELHNDLSVSQVASLQIGTGIPRLRKDDFLSIRIQLPHFIEQMSKVEGLKQEYIKNKEKELSLEKEILGLKDEAFREFASIKHTFRQYLNALKSNVSGTRKFISNNDSKNISLQTVYSKNLNRNLGEHLISLEGTIDSMSKLLTSFEEHSSLLIPVEVNLKNLVEEAQNRFINHDIFQFEKLYIDSESFAQFDGEQIEPLVYIHPEDFFRVFSNIVSNAIEHGFKNRTNNIITTTLSLDTDNLFCILEIANNGKPMEEEFTLKHLITRGERTSDSEGSGVGGADIKNTLEKYNGTIEIKKDQKAEFPVSYIIGLPIVVSSI